MDNLIHGFLKNIHINRYIYICFQGLESKNFFLTFFFEIIQ